MEPLPEELPLAICAVIVLDREGKILSLNRDCEVLTGYHSHQVEGEHLWERLLPAAETQSTRGWLDALSANPSPEHHDHHLLTADGDRKPMRWSPAVVMGGETVVLAGVEVTDQRPIQSALAEREARLDAILETAAEGIVTIDEHGIIESFNPAAERMFGYSAGDLVGQNVKVLSLIHI